MSLNELLLGNLMFSFLSGDRLIARSLIFSIDSNTNQANCNDNRSEAEGIVR